ncbi:MAG TPA: hypothetical protein VM820_16690 [Vicinamibacterales bacterium]|jgi:hypothetical protein|nr:hypothetical protein [Vicinamibacterales bacterium]
MLRGVQVVVSGLALAVMLAAANVAQAQDPAAKPVLPLEGDAVVMTILIKPDKTADFESVVAKYKEALEKSEKPARKQQLAGMKFFKSSQMANNNAVYILYVDPVVKDEEYDISRVIAEVFPTEVQDIFNKYKEAFAGRAITPLNKVP